MPGPVADDLDVISVPLDWYGVNYYQPMLVGAPSNDALGDFAGFGLPAELPFGVREIESEQHRLRLGGRTRRAAEPLSC